MLTEFISSASVGHSTLARSGRRTRDRAAAMDAFTAEPAQAIPQMQDAGDLAMFTAAPSVDLAAAPAADPVAEAGVALAALKEDIEEVGEEISDLEESLTKDHHFLRKHQQTLEETSRQIARLKLALAKRAASSCK